MSSDPFPERVDAVKLFARNGSITAALPLARLQRLTGYLSDPGVQVDVQGKSQVAVDLHFGHDEEQRRLLTGTLDVRVKVVCQRCLQDMELELHSVLHLLVFDSEQEVQELPDTADGVVMDEDGLDVQELIEDELILSLPLVPLHEDASCSEILNVLTQKAGVKETEGKPNPFAVLAGLKVKTDK